MKILITGASGMIGTAVAAYLASVPWPMRWTSKAKKQIYTNRITPG